MPNEKNGTYIGWIRQINKDHFEECIDLFGDGGKKTGSNANWCFIR